MLYTLKWKHFDGIKNSFLDPLNNPRNILNDHLVLHIRISNHVLGRHPCNDLFLMERVAHGRIKLF